MSAAERLPDFEPVARLDELPEDAPVGLVTPGGVAVCLVRQGDVVHALADRCSHREFPLSAGLVEGCELECAWHGATFDLRTGAARRAPAVDPVPVYEVRVENGMVLVRAGAPPGSG